MPSEPSWDAVRHELLGVPDVSEARMMGRAALKTGSKMFAFDFGEEIVLKVGRERAAELVDAEHAVPFDPGDRGRPMRDWARVNADHPDWVALADEARTLVAELQIDSKAD